jgi:hypothetical protein
MMFQCTIGAALLAIVTAMPTYVDNIRFAAGAVEKRLHPTLGYNIVKTTYRSQALPLNPVSFRKFKYIFLE